MQARSEPSNQALKLTRLSVCQLGGPGSVENAAAHWPCTQSAVQLNAGVGRPNEVSQARNWASLLGLPVICLVVACSTVAPPPSQPGEVEPAGTVVLRSDIESFVRKWEAGVGEWHGGEEISGYFCEFLLSNPPAFFAVMHDHPTTFDSWVRSLPEMTFVDYGTNVPDPEELRQAMIKRLEDLWLTEPEVLERHGGLVGRLLEVLRETTVRQEEI